MTDFFAPSFFPVNAKQDKPDPFPQQRGKHLNGSKKNSKSRGNIDADDTSATPSDEFVNDNYDNKRESDLNATRNVVQPRKDPKRNWRNSTYARSRHMW